MTEVYSGNDQEPDGNLHGELERLILFLHAVYRLETTQPGGYFCCPGLDIKTTQSRNDSPIQLIDLCVSPNLRSQTRCKACQIMTYMVEQHPHLVTPQDTGWVQRTPSDTSSILNR